MPINSDKLSHRRRLLLLLIASAFLVWQVPAMDAFDRMAGSTKDVSDLIAIGGFITWALALVALLAIGRRLKPGALQTAMLEDELVHANRRKAFLAGYVGMMVVSAALFALGMFVPATAIDAAQAFLVTGVVVPIYAFVILDARHG